VVAVVAVAAVAPAPAAVAVARLWCLTYSQLAVVAVVAADHHVHFYGAAQAAVQVI
jgi:hypothetical protein